MLNQFAEIAHYRGVGHSASIRCINPLHEDHGIRDDRMQGRRSPRAFQLTELCGLPGSRAAMGSGGRAMRYWPCCWCGDLPEAEPPDIVTRNEVGSFWYLIKY